MLLSLLVFRVVFLIHTGSGFVPVVVGPKGSEELAVCTLVEAFIRVGLRLQ